MTGVELIAAERQRQIDVEGWTPEHDDTHSSGQMLAAANCYIRKTQGRDWLISGWPWADECPKPSKDPVRNLVKAGALIAAEIDRLQRLQ